MFTKTKARKQLKKFRDFLNENRCWFCTLQCRLLPECKYCHLIYQVNYSYIYNKKATCQTFQKSILSENFQRLYVIYEDYLIRKNWLNYKHNWKRQRHCCTS